MVGGKANGSGGTTTDPRTRTISRTELGTIQQPPASSLYRSNRSWLAGGLAAQQYHSPSGPDPVASGWIMNDTPGLSATHTITVIELGRSDSRTKHRVVVGVVQE